MITREEAQQVLDALEEYVGVVVSVNDPNSWTTKVSDGGEPARKAIETLRTRLEQPQPFQVLPHDFAKAVEQQVLAVLEWNLPVIEDFGDKEQLHKQHKAIELLRARLSAPEPEPWCACRWDSEDKRIATCERHQGWLDVIAEWADRAREAEQKLRIKNMDRQCPSCGGFCKKSGCERENTAPPQREWQGLTRSDADSLRVSYTKNGFVQVDAMLMRVDEMLRERNT